MVFPSRQNQPLSGSLSRRRFLQLSGVALAAGCRPSAPDTETLVVYCALDREFAEPVLNRFSQETGIKVLATYDVESTKTVGLTQRLVAEAARPRCDLFWNNEILNTLRLKQAGLLRKVEIREAERFPAQFRSASDDWCGFAARARVLLVNTDLVEPAGMPRGLDDLVGGQWDDRFGFAKPLFGTTATHAACLFAVWGAERAERFWRGMFAKGRMLGGNKQVAEAVGAGQLACGLTDTDDAMIELDAHAPVQIVYPGQQPDGEGTLFIPNTLAAIAGRPDSVPVGRLIEFLLSAPVELLLARGRSAQIPLARELAGQARVETPATIRPMEVDFEQAAAEWDRAADFLATLLQSGGHR
jgi:iron(III) transport system substrate-binding protein